MNAPTQLLPRILSLGPPLTAADHDYWLERDRTTYAALLSLGAPALSAADATSIITRLLAVTSAPRGGALTLETKHCEDRLIAAILPQLPVRDVLAALLSLASRRVNNQRTSGCIRSYIFGAPELEQWAVKFRAQLARLVRHALGRATTEACLRALARPESERATHENVLIARNLTRFARDAALASEVFLHLFGKLRAPKSRLLRAYLEARTDLTKGRGLPFKTLQGIAGTFHPKTKRRALHELAPSDKLKRDVDEELAADATTVGLIRRFYGGQAQLEPEMIGALQRDAETLPLWNAHVAVVIDASASMRGIGHRLFNSIAIAAAVAEIIRLRARKFELIVAGGQSAKSTAFPIPSGATSLAASIVEAAARQPDCIVVLSDGYENREQGDAASIARVLEKLRAPSRIVQVLPAFTERENTAGRQLAPTWPMVQETGLGTFSALWLRLRAQTMPEQTLRELVDRTYFPIGQ